MYWHHYEVLLSIAVKFWVLQAMNQQESSQAAYPSESEILALAQNVAELIEEKVITHLTSLHPQVAT